MTRKALLRFWLAALVLWAGCADQNAPADNSRPASQTLRIGLGVAASSGGGEQAGIRQVVQNISSEPLLNYGRDGRPVPILAESWARADDGLSFRLKLRDAHFHDGTPVTSTDVLAALERGMPRLMGPAYGDVREIQAASDREIDIRLTAPVPVSARSPGSEHHKTGRPFDLGWPVSPGRFKGGRWLRRDGGQRQLPPGHAHAPANRVEAVPVGPFRMGRPLARQCGHAVRSRERCAGFARAVEPSQDLLLSTPLRVHRPVQPAKSGAREIR